MSEIRWLPGVTLDQDPEAVLDYEMDFAEWLKTDTLTSVAVTPVNCEASDAEIDGSVAKFRVSAVARGAAVTLRPTSSSGQTDDFTVKYRPTQR